MFFVWSNGMGVKGQERWAPYHENEEELADYLESKKNNPLKPDEKKEKDYSKEFTMGNIGLNNI